MRSACHLAWRNHARLAWIWLGDGLGLLHTGTVEIPMAPMRRLTVLLAVPRLVLATVPECSPLLTTGQRQRHAGAMGLEIGEMDLAVMIANEPPDRGQPQS